MLVHRLISAIRRFFGRHDGNVWTASADGIYSVTYGKRNED